MTEIDPHAPVKRPEFRNINAFKDLPSYRLPPAGWVSILHRISGAVMFLLLPFVIWMFDTSVSSEISFMKFKSAFNVGLLGVPGVIWKLLALALIWVWQHEHCVCVAYALPHALPLQPFPLVLVRPVLPTCCR